MDSITPVELKTKLDAGENPVLLDVREEWEYQTCAIEQSIHICMANINQMLEQLTKEKETVVICHHGMRSFQVGTYLEQNGFTKIINLEGGIDAWAKTVDVNMAQY